MWSSILVKLLLAQCVVAVIIIVVLKNILDKNLMESAIRRLEGWPQTGHPSAVTEITVIFHKNLSPVNKERVLKASLKHFTDAVKPVFQIDKKIMGGIIIKVGENTLDYSLKDRLRLAFSGRDSAQ